MRKLLVSVWQRNYKKSVTRLNEKLHCITALLSEPGTTVIPKFSWFCFQNISSKVFGCFRILHKQGMPVSLQATS